jgi:predicted enzyme related to lactoylglutathione lyase
VAVTSARARNERTGGTHLDLRVDDVSAAAQQIVAVGGTVVRAPDVYRPDGEPMLEWAVMRDPFGNEFCIIRWPLDQQQDS